ncbi:hypothetical protein NPIL_281011 [Nephila pilipes]|uniref:Uncharacterized protein n=1 Tax=Nephila pilipes TaxID=299642 RepID=A0A8X6IKF9_NEPPI|nr:hypothetical protein NPIL_281011 [Nephila pilipes]
MICGQRRTATAAKRTYGTSIRHVQAMHKWRNAATSCKRTDGERENQHLAKGKKMTAEKKVAIILAQQTCIMVPRYQQCDRSWPTVYR